MLCAAVAALPRLRTLSVAHCFLDYAGIQAIVPALPTAFPSRLASGADLEEDAPFGTTPIAALLGTAVTRTPPSANPINTPPGVTPNGYPSLTAPAGPPSEATATGAFPRATPPIDTPSGAVGAATSTPAEAAATDALPRTTPPVGLQKLDVRGGWLQDSGLAGIALALQPHTGLQMLALAETEVSEAGWGPLAALLRESLTSLEQLHVGGNRVGVQGMQVCVEEGG